MVWAARAERRGKQLLLRIEAGAFLPQHAQLSTLSLRHKYWRAKLGTFRLSTPSRWRESSPSESLHMSCRLGFLSFNNQIPNNKQRQRAFRPWALIAFSLINPVLFALHITMSSSINIPTRTGYAATSSKAAASSSSSSYSSSSPRTSPQNQATSTPSSPNNKYGHDRRPSLLSEFPLSF
jgi:hypothetical protein